MRLLQSFIQITLLSLLMGVHSDVHLQPLTSISDKASPRARPRLIGPMVGSVTFRSARVWAQLQQLGKNDRLPAWLEYQALNSSGQPAGPILRSEPLALTAQQSTATWLLDHLQPGTSYQYQVRWKRQPREDSTKVNRLQTEALWHWRTDPPPLRILASSCAYTNDENTDRPGSPYGQSTVIFESMAKRRPDVSLWMGDSVYFRETDADDRSAMAQRYDQWRALPQLQPLLHQGRHLATWDDHDYGPNDSNASNPTKDVSLDLFKQYWANPSHGLPGLPGVFTQARASDVEFFLLDNRWYRDSDKLIDSDRQMLGAGQLRWLKNALIGSTATWKFVITGSQVLNLQNAYEGWHHFPGEQQAFLTWLEQQKIPGVMLLSGDRHFSVLLKKERPEHYPLYELTCSPSTARAYLKPVNDLKNNETIVQGTAVTQNNFCELEITGPRGQRQLQIGIRDANGSEIWSRNIKESELR
jgi:alkaline phosphatase D